MARAAARAEARSPVAIELRDLLELRGPGEALRLNAPRVRVVTSGGHLSPYKGRGIEFDESRPYQPGDDLRTIDWRVTARTGKPHTKVFREERNRPVIVWLDLRKPMLFATRGAYKAVRAAELAMLVAWSAIANGDRLGGLVFAEGEHQELRPALGRRAALRFAQAVAAPSLWHARAAEKRPAGGAGPADAEHALKRLARVARPGSLIFLMSDFRELGPDADRHVRDLSLHCDLVLVHVFDPIEAELPPPGRYRIQGPARSFGVDTSGPEGRAAYRARFESRKARLVALARSPGVRLIECATSDDPQRVLKQSFR
jgi:uncharacterized protein (DUF58 family)